MSEVVAEQAAAAVATTRLLTELAPITGRVATSEVAVSTSTAAQEWAASGAMALTGRPDGCAQPVIGAPASALAAALGVFGWVAPSWATRDDPLPGPQLLGERAALAGLSRRAPWSAGGAMRILPTCDGWLAVSLPRSTDVDLLPALISGPVGEPWRQLADWLAGTPTTAALERTTLLGLAAAAVPEACAVAPLRRPGVVVQGGGRRRVRHSNPRVLDLSALWAGPLATHLLALRGADVVKVESRSRLDGARRGVAGFFDLLHHAHRSVVLDFDSAGGRAQLAALVRGADLVVEASRPRALRELGIDPCAVTAAGTSWLSITAYGREHPQRIGFGDDVAAGAGLVAWLNGRPVPAGDALADPLTGGWAAAVAAAALGAPRAYLLDVSMHDVAAAAAAQPVASGLTCVPAAPRARPVPGRAPAPGAHNHQLRTEPDGSTWLTCVQRAEPPA